MAKKSRSAKKEKAEERKGEEHLDEMKKDLFMAKRSRSAKKKKAEERKVQEHLDEIKQDLEELRTKLGMTRRSDLTKLPMEAARKLSDTSTEIIKTASDVFERTLKVAQYAAVGAVEGAKKALHEETRRETKRQKKTKS